MPGAFLGVLTPAAERSATPPVPWPPPQADRPRTACFCLASQTFLELGVMEEMQFLDNNTLHDDDGDPSNDMMGLEGFAEVRPGHWRGRGRRLRAAGYKACLPALTSQPF